MAFTEAFRESTTLKLVVPAWAILLLKFMFAGVDFKYGEFAIEFAPMGAVAFGTALAAILAIWLGREWRKAHYAE
jgi:hypothetical protein